MVEAQSDLYPLIQACLGEKDTAKIMLTIKNTVAYVFNRT
jgi:hypothetical protein